MSFTDSGVIRRASSAAPARSANRGASSRARSTISWPVTLRVGDVEGCMWCSYRLDKSSSGASVSRRPTGKSCKP